MNSANVSQDKNCGKKKTKATQKRKGPSSNKPQKISKLLLFPDNHPASALRSHANTPVAATKPISAKPYLQQSFHFPIHLYRFLHLRVLLSIFRHQQDM